MRRSLPTTKIKSPSPAPAFPPVLACTTATLGLAGAFPAVAAVAAEAAPEPERGASGVVFADKDDDRVGTGGTTLPPPDAPVASEPLYPSGGGIIPGSADTFPNRSWRGAAESSDSPGDADWRCFTARGPTESSVSPTTDRRTTLLVESLRTAVPVLATVVLETARLGASGWTGAGGDDTVLPADEGPSALRARMALLDTMVAGFTPAAEATETGRLDTAGSSSVESVRYP